MGAIHFVTRDIFDLNRSGENRTLFRLANRLHHTTRARVIERQLLLHPGDPLSPEALRESERLLRANAYLYDASIRPIDSGQGTVDLEVTTRDVWTLQVGVSFHHAGGVNASTFELEDSNFLGTGKDLTVARRAGVDRTSNLFRFRDPSLAGSRATLDLRLSNNSDGRSRFLMLDRPFFSLDSRWAAGGTIFSDHRIDSLYRLGHVAQRFHRRRDFVELYAGMSSGLDLGGASRWKVGFTYDRYRFSPASLVPGARGAAAALPLPGDHRLSYPWIGYETIEDGFITAHDVERIQRTEDLNLGRHLLIRLGRSERFFGGGDAATVVQALAAEGWAPNGRQMLLSQASLSGRWQRGGVANGLVSASLRYYARDFGNHLFYAALSGDLAHRLDPETQLLLGGDNGLRGYPLRFANGDRRALLTLEQRFYSDRELFHLAYAGAAVFFDAGRAWFPGAGPDRSQRLLKDVGIGLRLFSSRAYRGSVLHFDVAYPLDRSGGIKALQWLISTGESF